MKGNKASISLNMTSTELYEGQKLDVDVTVDPEVSKSRVFR
jgi:hypothetical protein